MLAARSNIREPAVPERCCCLDAPLTTYARTKNAEHSSLLRTCEGSFGLMFLSLKPDLVSPKTTTRVRTSVRENDPSAACYQHTRVCKP